MSLGDNSLDIVDGAVERATVLQFQRTHSGGKAATLLISATLCPAVQVASRIGVTTTRGIHRAERGIGRYLVKLAFCLDE